VSTEKIVNGAGAKAALPLDLAAELLAHERRADTLDLPDWARGSDVQVKAVAARGSAAWPGRETCGVSRAEWAKARVEAFLTMLEDGEREHAGYTRDDDLLPAGHPLREAKADAKFTEGKHPRGKDGRFITMGALVDMPDGVGGSNGTQRGKVVGEDAGKGTLTVEKRDGSRVTVSAKDVDVAKAAPGKGKDKDHAGTDNEKAPKKDSTDPTDADRAKHDSLSPEARAVLAVLAAGRPVADGTSVELAELGRAKLVGGTFRKPTLKPEGVRVAAAGGDGDGDRDGDDSGSLEDLDGADAPPAGGGGAIGRPATPPPTAAERREDRSVGRAEARAAAEGDRPDPDATAKYDVGAQVQFRPYSARGDAAPVTGTITAKDADTYTVERANGTVSFFTEDQLSPVPDSGSGGEPLDQLFERDPALAGSVAGVALGGRPRKLTDDEAATVRDTVDPELVRVYRDGDDYFAEKGEPGFTHAAAKADGDPPEPAGPIDRLLSQDPRLAGRVAAVALSGNRVRLSESEAALVRATMDPEVVRVFRDGDDLFAEKGEAGFRHATALDAARGRSTAGQGGEKGLEEELRDLLAQYLATTTEEKRAPLDTTGSALLTGPVSLEDRPTPVIGKVERKAAGATGLVLADDDTGYVEAIVSVTGIVDEVDDVILPGAYAATLKTRTPKGVWSHDWDKWCARTEGIEELMPGDPRLPELTRSGEKWPKEAGALLVKARFNLATQQGKDAYSNVTFFADECEWSIGYNVRQGKSNRDALGRRLIKEIDLFEYSPVLFGAMPLASTVAVKGRQAADERKTLAPASTCTDCGGVLA